MPTALVTGITGQDGSYLAERLAADGWAVHGMVQADDTSAGDLRARVDGVVLHCGDLRSPGNVGEIVAEVAPDEIYNLGGVSSVAMSWQEPLLTAQVSGIGAAAVFDAAWQLRERTGRDVRVLQASSAEIFGDATESPQSERTRIMPANPYGAAKAYAHHLIQIYRQRGLHAVACILYNHESPRRPASFVTRRITQAAARIAAGEQQWLTLGNLDARRDWGWAPDYVDAMVRALRHPTPDDYVVATGQAHSVGEFAAAAFAHVGIGDWRQCVRVDENFVRPTDPAELVGDASRARARLSWRPAVSFGELVTRMVDHDIQLLASDHVPDVDGR